jgi:restriction endonuclease BamHI
MKFVRTVVVFDRRNLLGSEQWEKMHESYVSALRGVVHPPGSDRFVIRKRMRKVNAAGLPTTQWMRNGVVPIKEQFLTKLRLAGWLPEKPAGLLLGSPALKQAHEKAEVLMKEYPGNRDYRLQDQDWAKVFQ